MSSFSIGVPGGKSLAEVLVSLPSPWEIQKDLVPGPIFPWAQALKGTESAASGTGR